MVGKLKAKKYALANFIIFTLCFCSIWVSYVDFSRREIPETAVYIISSTALIVLFLHPEVVAWHNFLAAAVLFLCLWSTGELYYRWTGVDGLGAGDAKLLGAGTLLLGPMKIPELLLLSSFGGIVACLVVGWRTGKMPEGIPFGPFISYAIIICYFQEPLFLSAYS